MVGTTSSQDYVTTPGAYDTATPTSTRSDGFALKLSPPGPLSTPSARYVYDAEGRRVKSIVGGVTSVHVGALYEVRGQIRLKYYFFGGQRVAMREIAPDATRLYYFLGDHLGSTSLALDSTGTVVSELRYSPFGRTRYSSGSTPTDRRFTGQRFEGEALGGLYDYGARFYDSNIGLFVQPDSVVPDPVRVVAFNRYAYAWNNPLRYTDPTGHSPASDAATSLLQSLMGGLMSGSMMYAWGPTQQFPRADQDILDATVMIESKYQYKGADSKIYVVADQEPSSVGTVVEGNVVISHNHFGALNP